jgi:hypothetical protein
LGLVIASQTQNVEVQWSLVANLGAIEIFGRIEKRLMEYSPTLHFVILDIIATIIHL